MNSLELLNKVLMSIRSQKIQKFDFAIHKVVWLGSLILISFTEKRDFFDSTKSKMKNDPAKHSFYLDVSSEKGPDSDFPNQKKSKKLKTGSTFFQNVESRENIQFLKPFYSRIGLQDKIFTTKFVQCPFFFSNCAPFWIRYEPFLSEEIMYQDLFRSEFTFFPEMILRAKSSSFDNRITQYWDLQLPSFTLAKNSTFLKLGLDSNCEKFAIFKIALHDPKNFDSSNKSRDPICLVEPNEIEKAQPYPTEQDLNSSGFDSIILKQSVGSGVSLNWDNQIDLDSLISIGLENYCHPIHNFKKKGLVLEEYLWVSTPNISLDSFDYPKSSYHASKEPLVTAVPLQIPSKIDLKSDTINFIIAQDSNLGLHIEKTMNVTKSFLGFYLSNINDNIKVLWNESFIFSKNDCLSSCDLFFQNSINSDPLKTKVHDVHLTSSKSVALDFDVFEKNDFHLFSSHPFSRYVEPRNKTNFIWNSGFSIDPTPLIFDSYLKVKEVIQSHIQPTEESFLIDTLTHLKHLSLRTFSTPKIRFEEFKRSVTSLFFSIDKWAFKDFFLSLKSILISKKFNDKGIKPFSNELLTEDPLSEGELLKQTVQLKNRKLLSRTDEIKTNFVVFHHPVRTIDDNASKRGEKIFVRHRETGLFNQIAYKVKETSTKLKWKSTPFIYPKPAVTQIANRIDVTDRFYKKDLKATRVNLLDKGLTQNLAVNSSVLQLIHPRYETCSKTKNHLDVLPGEKFTSPIWHNIEKIVALRPYRNEYLDIIFISKTQIEHEASRPENFLDEITPVTLKIMQGSPFSRSLFAISASRLTNEQVRHTHQLIDQFNKIEINFLNVSSEFSIKASGTPLPNKEGWGIEVELTASDVFRPKLVSQEIIFVLDGSKNTSHKHFDTYKAGILRALKNLTPDTKFNIVYLGKTLEMLFKSSVSASQDKLLQGRRFVDKATSHQTQETGTILKTIVDLAPEKSDTTLTTVVLMADSVLPQKQTIYYEEIQKLVKKVDGNFHLVTAALNTIERKNLKFISLIGGGEDIEFSSTSSFIRKFSSFIRSYKYPYLMNIQITPLSDGVDILPSKNLTNPVYLTKPYKFYAISKSPEPFEILIQAQVEGKIIEVRKTVKPVQNESIRSKIKGVLDHKKAADAFENYVKNRDLSKLDETNKQLDLFDIQL